MSERSLVRLGLVFLILARSAVFVFWEQSYFDSDQAVMGLMAKHLSELRAFPLFIYGQNYMLGVEAWLAAPVFLVAGVSAAALRVPLLGLNIGIALLLLRILERELGLRPLVAAAASAFFVLAPPGTAASLVEAGGGNVEPFVYVLLLWLTRHRPAWCGVVLGIGFLNREFTLYGFAALLIIQAAEGSLFTREGGRRLWTLFRSAAEVWLVVQFLRLSSSALGPGTTVADLADRTTNITELVRRICLDPWASLRGLWNVVTVHWPMLFGTEARPLASFAILSRASQGLVGSWMLVAGAMLLAASRLGFLVGMRRAWKKEHAFGAYLVMVGVFSVVGFVVGRCGQIGSLRYELLSVLGAVGLGAWYLAVERARVLRFVWIGLVAGWSLVASAGHVALWAEYLHRPPVGPKQLIARHLEARGIRYASSDYWIAYYVTFITNERILVDAPEVRRIELYAQEYARHKDEAVRVSRSPCGDGRPAVAGVYFCRPE